MSTPINDPPKASRIIETSGKHDKRRDILLDRLASLTDQMNVTIKRMDAQDNYSGQRPIWILCGLVAVYLSIDLLSNLSAATSAVQQGAAGAMSAAKLVAVYIFARCAEQIARSGSR